jgi:uncharacterized protein YprB with RNaseH-like and TPR domain
MLTASFIFAKGISDEQERLLWGRGITSWELARAHPDEVAEVLGATRAGKLCEQIAEAQAAQAARDKAFFRAWPERELWRLWKGLCAPERIALVDIETTGLTPGYDQITVIGLADSRQARAFVAGRPQPGDEPIEKFPEALKDYDLMVTFNGTSFDLPFIERQFRPTGFRWELPHLDLLPLARSQGLTGGLKDMEKQIGIARDAHIAEVRGGEAIALWGQWKNGDANAYRKLITYCKADCTNLARFADRLYGDRWAKLHTAHAKTVDFAKLKGQQLTIFG